MDISSRDLAQSARKATASPLPPMVACDLCEAPFILPAEIAAQGTIYGLLVCSQCVEDQLQSEIHQ